ncbi:hypothetical protein ES705_50142 [subsurface metagenome]
MSKTKKRYDSKYKVTRIHLGDYLALKRISQVADISMAEALHRLIEHQAQLPLLDMGIKPAPVAQVTGIPTPAFRIGVHKPMSVIIAEAAIATNGSKAAAFRIKNKGARYA